MRYRLIEIFKKIEYTPFPEMTMKSNLANQFTDYALNKIVDEMIANGVICPPCKEGDVVYVVCRSHFSKNASIREQKATHLKYINGYWYIDTDTHFDKEYGLSVFTNYEAAEKALRGEGE